MTRGGLWQNNNVNFDSIELSILTIFEMSTTSGWEDVMEDNISTTNIGQVPNINIQVEYARLFFVLWVIIG